jgi:hypothetical protein
LFTFLFEAGLQIDQCAHPRLDELGNPSVVQLPDGHGVEVVQLGAPDALHGDEVGGFEHVKVFHHAESCEVVGFLA